MNDLRNRIIADLLSHPGSHAREIAARLALSGNVIGGCLRRMRGAGLVHVVGLGEFDADGRSDSRWFAGAEQRPALCQRDRDRRERAAAALLDLAAHPGSRAQDLAARHGWSVEHGGSILRELRKRGLAEAELTRPGGRRVCRWYLIGCRPPPPQSAADAAREAASKMDRFIAPEDLETMAHYRLSRDERRRLEGRPVVW